MASKNTSSTSKLAFLQALGVAIYCSLVGTFMWNIEKIFHGKPNLAGPIAMLLLFSTSALVCALIVFYRPYRLFFDGKKKEAIDLVLYTAGFLFCFFLVFISLAIFV